MREQILITSVSGLVCTKLIAILLMCSGSVVNAQGLRVSFTNEPFVHPGVVATLLQTWRSEADEQVAVEVNPVYGSRHNGAEVYVFLNDGKPPVVGNDFGELMCRIEYQYCGVTPAGVHVLRVDEYAGVSGHFVHLLFLVSEPDYGLAGFDSTNRIITAAQSRKRWVLKTLGSKFVGMWCGEIWLEGDTVYIGPSTVGEHTNEVYSADVAWAEKVQVVVDRSYNNPLPLAPREDWTPYSYSKEDDGMRRFVYRTQGGRTNSTMSLGGLRPWWPRYSTPTQTVEYVVQVDDTVHSIARKFIVAKQPILDFNGLKIDDELIPGQKILVPYE